MKLLVTFSFMYFLSLGLSAQIENTIQLKLEENAVVKHPIKDNNVKVIINDTLVRHLVTDENGITGFIEIPDGEYSMTVIVDSYKEYYVKKVKLNKANSKHLNLKLTKI